MRDVEGVYEYLRILLLKIGTSALLLAGVLIVISLENPWLALILLAVSILSIGCFKKISDFGHEMLPEKQPGRRRF